MAKTPGYGGYVLNLDFNTGAAEIVDLPQDLKENYLGGKGFGARILYDELPAQCDPLSPDNILVLATGAFTGTLVPTGCRAVITTKSPLTGAWLDSNCGGTFGAEMKMAGFDLIKIKSRAEKPVYLYINNHRVTVEDAGEIWGLDTFSTHNWLKKKHGEKCKVACIGPAGEKLVPIAGVQAEGRSFGRGGAGAVFGSKNLKAIVVTGDQSIEIADYAEFLRENKEAYNEVAISSDTGGSRPKYGTSAIYSFIKEAGVLPIKNFQGGSYPGMEKVDEHALLEELYEKNRACFACPIGCSKYSRVKKGPYEGKFVEGPEYEDVWGFGAQCGNSELGSIAYAEYLCDYYGIDAVTVGNAIGFLMECFEKGIVTKDEIGFQVSFGDHQAIIRLVHLIGKKEGIGRIIGQGVRKAAAQFGGGSERFAMHVKGLELPAYDPRGAYGMGLAFATSDRGGCHLRAWPVGEEVLNTSGRIDPYAIEFKAELVKADQDWLAVIDSLGLCMFSTFALGPNQVTDLLYALTGEKAFSSTRKLMKIGERIYNLTRLFNIREGLTRQDDSLPPRLLEEPLNEGPAKGNVVPLQEMLNEYYLVRNWDEEGKPEPAKLKQLGLEERPWK
jgi:aldehyde:ferredoxin oxidoreductase